MTEDEKRQNLRQKILTGEERHAKRSISNSARNVRDNAVGFVKENPVSTIVGAAAIGAILALTIPARGRRLSLQAARRAISLAVTAAEASRALSAGLMDDVGKTARKGQDTLEDLGDTLGDGARSLRRGAAHRAAKATDNVASLRRSVRKKAGRTMRDLSDRIN